MNNYQNLPAELRQNGLFCLWRRENQKGRLTKMPYKTNGYRARSTEKADFVDFNTAMRYVGNYNGIGLGIFDGYCAVDIDHCVTDGVLSDLATEIVNTFNSYTELSPSGEGVRIIFKAQGIEYDKKRYYINNHKLGLEIYVSGCTNKYVTLTGNVIKNLPINLAFVPMDPRLGEYQYDGFDFFLKETDADLIFPMHMWQNYEGIALFKRKITNSGMADRVMDISRENQVFLIGEE